MSAQSGLAFVVVQHLDSSHKSIMVDLLQQTTEMRVQQAFDGQAVEPNNIYLIPPGFELALLHGTLHLLPPPESTRVHLPIDYFLRSLAEDARELSIAVILSGAGSDGALGIKAIKGRGGLVIVQEPESAHFESMPRAAIATGMADVILPPDQMPAQLIAFVQLALAAHLKGKTSHLLEPLQSLQKVFLLLRDQTGHDFTQYKKSTIGRRIERRMALNHIEVVSDYVHYLQHNTTEVDALFRDLLIGVTAFFRDPEAFDVLEQRVIPALLADRGKRDPLRVWVAGCSTGEEAYSIGILIREQMEAREQILDVQIFATDIDGQAVEEARLGLYPANIVLDVPPERLERWFTREHEQYRVSKVIRDIVVFAQQSVIKDPPFSRLDLVSCRNLLIYLEPEMQQQIIPLFHYALKPGGYLFLGTSESLGSFTGLFETVDRKQKLFRAIPGDGGFRVSLGVTGHNRLDRLARGGESLPSEKVSMRALVERVLLDSYAPASVIIDEQFNALYFHRQTGKYLEPVSGEASLNLLSMAREGLRLPLTIAVRKVVATHQEVRIENIHVRVSDNIQTINLIVRPVENAGASAGLMIVLFEEVAVLAERPAEISPDGFDERDRRLADLEQELRSTREYLQTTGEEWQASNEELKSVNEELQSANEELQSTMEEMETAKEELQSVNEELATVNTELESKIDELTQSNSDLDNLLSNVKVGIIFLNRQLRIQRFTPAAVELVNLIPGDIGRPFEHIVSNIIGDSMIERVRMVLDTLRYYEDEVQTRNGRWYWMGVGPYRVEDNGIEGVVITFTEITEQKRAQDGLNALAERMAGQPGSGFAYQHLTSLLAALTRWYRFLNTSANEHAVYQEMCRVVLASGDYRLVWVGERTKTHRVTPVGHAGQDEGYLTLVERADMQGEQAEGPDIRALTSGAPAVSEDIASDDQFGPLREEAVKRGLRSTVALPLKDKANQVLGSLNVYSAEPNGFDAPEIEWLTALTESLIASFRSVMPDEPAEA